MYGSASGALKNSVTTHFISDLNTLEQAINNSPDKDDLTELFEAVVNLKQNFVVRDPTTLRKNIESFQTAAEKFNNRTDLPKITSLLSRIKKVSERSVTMKLPPQHKRTMEMTSHATEMKKFSSPRSAEMIVNSSRKVKHDASTQTELESPTLSRRSTSSIRKPTSSIVPSISRPVGSIFPSRDHVPSTSVTTHSAPAVTVTAKSVTPGKKHSNWDKFRKFYNKYVSPVLMVVGPILMIAGCIVAFANPYSALIIFGIGVVITAVWFIGYLINQAHIYAKIHSWNTEPWRHK